jgi:NitT/TauT family transport system permease protein
VKTADRLADSRLLAAHVATRPWLVRWYLEHERPVLGATAVVLFIAFWEGLTRGWWADLLTPLIGASAARWRINPIFLSSPTAIAAAFYRVFFVTGEIWNDLRVSGVEYLLGFLLAVAVGIPLGLTAGWYRRFYYAVEPFLSALNATPQVAFLPLIIVWVGIGLWSKIVVIFLLTVLPIAISALAGVKTIDARLLRVARSFGSPEWHLFRNIILPSSVPFLLAGLRLAVGRAMIGIVVGELYAATAGVGFMINVAGSSFQTDKVFVGVIIIAATGLFLIEILRRIEARVEVWRPKVGAAR